MNEASWGPDGFLTNGTKVGAMTLETERLLLRGFCPDDLREVMNWDKERSKDLAAENARQFLDFCYRQYETIAMGPWAMLLKKSGKIVGSCGFIAVRNFCGELNWFVAAEHRGQSFAPEAVKALLNFGFRDLGLLRIQARCEADNLSSERVMQKLGMQPSQAPSGDSLRNGEKMYAVLCQDFVPPA